MFRFVKLKQKYNELPGGLTIFCGQNVKFCGYDIEEDTEENMIKRLSGQKEFLIMRKPDKMKPDSWLYHICSQDREYKCKRSETHHHELTILSSFPINFNEYNRWMGQAIEFSIPDKCSIIIRNGVLGGIESYADGKQIGLNEANHMIYLQKDKLQAGLDFIEQKFAEQEQYQQAENEERSGGLHDRTIRKLDIIQNYAEVYSSVEENHVNETAPLFYNKISPVFSEEYERLDRIAYNFTVGELPENEYRPGAQIVLMSTQGEELRGEITAAYESVDSSSLDILFNKVIDKEIIPSFGEIRLSFSTVNRDVQVAAVEQLKKSQCAGAAYINQVFHTKKYPPAGFEDKDLSALHKSLQAQKYPPNASQQKAIEQGIKTKDLYLVMGPPGTGKTTVILEWVKYFIRVEHKRVLVSSQNNKAVDNVLERLADEPDISMLRIGSEAKVQPKIVPYLFENKLNSYREEIRQQVASNEPILKEWIARWQKMSDKLEELSLSRDKLDRQYATLVNHIEGELRPAYKKIEVARHDLKSVQKRLQEQAHAFNKAYQKLKSAREGTGVFTKIKLFFMERTMLGDLDKTQATYENGRAMEEQCLVALNKAIREYQSIKAKLITSEYADILEARDGYEEQYKIVEALQNKILAAGEPSWALKISVAESVQDQAWFRRADIDRLAGLAQEKKARAEQLLQAFLTWKTKILDKQNYALLQTVLEEVQLVGATCIGVSSQRKFADLKFDITIIDEAGQILAHNALVPMSVSPKLIMLGDHKQIPPMTDADVVAVCESNNIQTDLLKKSLFEDMYERMPDENKMMLDTQYRMPKEIADIISDWFYEGAYKSFEKKAGLKGVLEFLSNRPLVVIDTSGQASRSETRGVPSGYYNNLEAECVIRILSRLKQDDRLDEDEIGIIAAYKAQVGYLREKLVEQGILSVEAADNMIATLDSFQGQERNIIIYSFVRSSPNKHPTDKRIGFLAELRRLNVAMTRCKKTLVMIGDMEYLSNCANEPDAEDDGNTPSEKMFGDFIRKMLDDIKNGSGDILSLENWK